MVHVDFAHDVPQGLLCGLMILQLFNDTRRFERIRRWPARFLRDRPQLIEGYPGSNGSKM